MKNLETARYKVFLQKNMKRSVPNASADTLHCPAVVARGNYMPGGHFMFPTGTLHLKNLLKQVFSEGGFYRASL